MFTVAHGSGESFSVILEHSPGEHINYFRAVPGAYAGQLVVAVEGKGRARVTMDSTALSDAGAHYVSSLEERLQETLDEWSAAIAKACPGP